MNARVIGMNSGVSPEQVEAVSRLLLGGFASISWDGDAVQRGAFTEALVPYIERQHAAGTISATVRPRCLPGADGSSTQSGDLARELVPRAVPIAHDDFLRALAFLDQNLAHDWREEYTGDKEGYMALAAAHRLASRPDAVVWVLDEDRAPSRYHAWGCLGEYRCFAGGDSGGADLIVVGKDGRLLSREEVERQPWHVAG